MEGQSTSAIIKSVQTKLRGLTSHWSQWPSLKRSTKNNYCGKYTANKILPRSWQECKWWSHDGNSMEVPRNTRHRGIIWSCNPIPCLGPEKITIQSDSCTTAKIQNPPRRPSTGKRRLWGTAIQWNATQPLNRMKRWCWQQRGHTKKLSYHKYFSERKGQVS